MAVNSPSAKQNTGTSRFMLVSVHFPQTDVLTYDINNLARCAPY